MSDQTPAKPSEFKANVGLILGFVAVFWVLEIVDAVLGGTTLQAHGIHPRSTDGLMGILFAPFLHGGWDHLTSNTLPFAVLGFFTVLHGRKAFIGATATIILIGGLGTWLTGESNSNHIGASSLIFGYFGFLLLAGVLERSLKGILIAVIVAVVYGSIIWGVLPNQPGISWQGHLFGLIGGGVAAYTMFRKQPATS